MSKRSKSRCQLQLVPRRLLQQRKKRMARKSRLSL